MTDGPYAESVGFQSGSDTSEEAADAAEFAGTLRWRVSEVIRARGGATRGELVAHFGGRFQPSTIGARLRELVIMGVITDSGDRRTCTDTGRAHVVWTACGVDDGSPVRRKDPREAEREAACERVRALWASLDGWCPCRHGELATMLEDKIARIERERNEARETVRRFAAWIERYPAPVRDHACAECVPGGEIVVAGFRCVPHEVERVSNEATNEEET